MTLQISDKCVSWHLTCISSLFQRNCKGNYTFYLHLAFSGLELHPVTAAAPPLPPDSTTPHLHALAPQPRDTPHLLTTDGVLSLLFTETFLLHLHPHHFPLSPHTAPALRLPRRETLHQHPLLAGPAPVPVTAPRAERGRGGDQSGTGVLHCKRGGMSAEMVRDMHHRVITEKGYNHVLNIVRGINNLFSLNKKLKLI